LELDPDSGAETNGWLGRAHLELGQWREAVAELSEALRRDPGNVAYLVHRGHAYLALRKWRAASEDYTECLRKDPKDPNFWEGRGQAYAALGQWDEAVADLTRAGALQPRVVAIRENLALALLGKGDGAGYGKACEAMLDRFGDTDDQDEAHAVAFACTRGTGAGVDPVRLLRLATKATAPRPDEGRPAADRAEVHLQLGAALHRVGAHAAALAQLAEAEKLRGREPSALDALFLALAHARLDQPEPARAALDRAVRQIEEAERGQKPSWQQRVTRTALRREAEELIRPPGRRP
jgi:Flp pilus assembly protein TadD